MDATIANRIKQLRAARGWTQEDLARAVGVSRQSINSIERNRYVPSLELALTLAQVFACPTDEIFSLQAAAISTIEMEEKPCMAYAVSTRIRGSSTRRDACCS